MHEEARRFTVRMKAIFPSYFKDVSVLDIGSADICGNNRFLFSNSDYTGVDIWPGNNVDRVIEAKDMTGLFNTVISTECLEHDANWKETVINALKMTHEYGIILITCASTGRLEHGTKKTTPQASPFTTDYYRNIEWKDIKPLVKHLYYFKYWYNKEAHDLYFVGFKQKPRFSPSLLRYLWIEIKYFFWLRVNDCKNGVKDFLVWLKYRQPKHR